MDFKTVYLSDKNRMRTDLWQQMTGQVNILCSGAKLKYSSEIIFADFVSVWYGQEFFNILKFALIKFMSGNNKLCGQRYWINSYDTAEQFVDLLLDSAYLQMCTYKGEFQPCKVMSNLWDISKISENRGYIWGFRLLSGVVDNGMINRHLQQTLWIVCTYELLKLF